MTEPSKSKTQDFVLACTSSINESPTKKKCIFFDMQHSNNAARVRLWLRLKGLYDMVDVKLLGHDDVESDAYEQINPLKKVRSLPIRECISSRLCNISKIALVRNPVHPS
jgi:hypothetical protein